MSAHIESHLVENRVFRPAKEFAKNARISSFAEYKKLYAKSIRSPEKFWAKEAADLTWRKKWTKVLDWRLPFAKWFVGGKLNASENCLDRHLSGPRRNKAAIIWEGEPGDRRVLTYQQLHREVCIFANILKRNGCKKGTRVLIYLPHIPEAAIAMSPSSKTSTRQSKVTKTLSASSFFGEHTSIFAFAKAVMSGGIAKLTM